MRTIRYPLPEGNITEETAAAMQAAIKDEITSLCVGISPMHQSIPGYPTNVDPRKATTMRDQLTELGRISDESARSARRAGPAERMGRAQELIATEGRPPATYPTALSLLMLLRDSIVTVADWNVVLDFVGKLPAHFANESEILEIRAFAAAQAGNNMQAIAELQTLIDLTGPTPERLGLMGGRYKRLTKAATASDAEKAAGSRQGDRLL